jgi:hypothetical protein
VTEIQDKFKFFKELLLAFEDNVGEMFRMECQEDWEDALQFVQKGRMKVFCEPA